MIQKFIEEHNQEIVELNNKLDLYYQLKHETHEKKELAIRLTMGSAYVAAVSVLMGMFPHVSALLVVGGITNAMLVAAGTWVIKDRRDRNHNHVYKRLKWEAIYGKIESFDKAFLQLMEEIEEGKKNRQLLLEGYQSRDEKEYADLQRELEYQLSQLNALIELAKYFNQVSKPRDQFSYYTRDKQELLERKKRQKDKEQLLPHRTIKQEEKKSELQTLYQSKDLLTNKREVTQGKEPELYRK